MVGARGAGVRLAGQRISPLGAAVALLSLAVAATPLASAAEDHRPHSASCAACTHTAALVYGELRAAGLKTREEEDLEAEQTTRRRLTHGRSELAIADAINAACGNGAPEGSAQQLSCDALVAEHGEELADRIFEEGIDGVREQLCVRLAAVCAEEHQEL